jgi:GntR family transcriptional repressor for pyruvate dehydrogenase complex
MGSRADATGRLDVPPAYVVVLEHLRRAIHLGEYKPGDKLPPERRHAEKLGVSRVTLREAIRVLEGEGYLATRRGSAGGATVLGPKETAATLRAQLRDNVGQLLAIQEFRLVNERLAAERAATRATGEDLDALRTTLDDMEASTDLGGFRQADSAFHLRIAQAADSPLLLQAIEDARAAMFLSLDALEYDVMLATSTKAHRKILAAIAEGDAARAGRAMAAHVKTTTDDLNDMLGAGTPAS